MDILNFISWIRGKRVVNTVDPAKTLIPVGLRDDRRDDDYLAGAISVEDLAAQIGGSSTYKVYTALLTQTGTNAPVATVLENTIGDISFSYLDVGLYYINSNGLFDESKTFFSLSTYDIGFAYKTTCGFSGNTDSLFIETRLLTVNTSTGAIQTTPSNGTLYNTPIEIRIYN